MPINTLLLPPYDLPWGSSIYAILSATNIVGESLFSVEGNGAVILTNPDRPVNLQNEPTITKASQIGVSWDEGAANGGSVVIDYYISYATLADTTYTVVPSIVDTAYTITGLSAGVTYKIKVQARNEFDLSDYSIEIDVLAGQIPDTPIAPTTTIQSSNV